MYLLSFLGQNRAWNYNLEMSAVNAFTHFQMEMVQFVATWHQKNANLWVDVAFISGNYLSFLGVAFRNVLAETTTGRCS